MSIIEHGITEPTITHPAWCDPGACGEDVVEARAVARYHWSANHELTIKDNDDPILGFALCRVDAIGVESVSEPTVVVGTDIMGNLTADDIEQMGHRLLAIAAKLRQAIATEAGA